MPKLGPIGYIFRNGEKVPLKHIPANELQLLINKLEMDLESLNGSEYAEYQAKLDEVIEELSYHDIPLSEYEQM